MSDYGDDGGEPMYVKPLVERHHFFSFHTDIATGTSRPSTRMRFKITTIQHLKRMMMMRQVSEAKKMMPRTTMLLSRAIPTRLQTMGKVATNPTETRRFPTTRELLLRS
jgi:hypothetical protein